MMRDMLMQNIQSFCYRRICQANCKHCRGTWFHLKIVKISQSVPFSKGKNETKDKVFFLTKAKAWLGFFEIVLLGVHSHKVHTFDVYKKLG